MVEQAFVEKRKLNAVVALLEAQGFHEIDEDIVSGRRAERIVEDSFELRPEFAGFLDDIILLPRQVDNGTPHVTAVPRKIAQYLGLGVEKEDVPLVDLYLAVRKFDGAYSRYQEQQYSHEQETHDKETALKRAKAQLFESNSRFKQAQADLSKLKKQKADEKDIKNADDKVQLCEGPWARHQRKVQKIEDELQQLKGNGIYPSNGLDQLYSLIQTLSKESGVEVRLPYEGKLVEPNNISLDKERDWLLERVYESNLGLRGVIPPPKPRKPSLWSRTPLGVKILGALVGLGVILWGYSELSKTPQRTNVRNNTELQPREQFIGRSNRKNLNVELLMSPSDRGDPDPSEGWTKVGQINVVPRGGGRGVRVPTKSVPDEQVVRQMRYDRASNAITLGGQEIIELERIPNYFLDNRFDAQWHSANTQKTYMLDANRNTGQVRIIEPGAMFPVTGHTDKRFVEGHETFEIDERDGEISFVFEGPKTPATKIVRKRNKEWLEQAKQHKGHDIVTFSYDRSEGKLIEMINYFRLTSTGWGTFGENRVVSEEEVRTCVFLPREDAEVINRMEYDKENNLVVLDGKRYHLQSRPEGHLDNKEDMLWESPLTRRVYSLDINRYTGQIKRMTKQSIVIPIHLMNRRYVGVNNVNRFLVDKHQILAVNSLGGKRFSYRTTVGKDWFERAMQNMSHDIVAFSYLQIGDELEEVIDYYDIEMDGRVEKTPYSGKGRKVPKEEIRKYLSGIARWNKGSVPFIPYMNRPLTEVSFNGRVVYVTSGKETQMHLAHNLRAPGKFDGKADFALRIWDLGPEFPNFGRGFGNTPKTPKSKIIYFDIGKQDITGKHHTRYDSLRVILENWPGHNQNRRGLPIFDIR